MRVNPTAYLLSPSLPLYLDLPPQTVLLASERLRLTVELPPLHRTTDLASLIHPQVAIFPVINPPKNLRVAVEDHMIMTMVPPTDTMVMSTETIRGREEMDTDQRAKALKERRICINCLYYVNKDGSHLCARDTSLVTGEPNLKRCEIERAPVEGPEDGRCGIEGVYFRN